MSGTGFGPPAIGYSRRVGLRGVPSIREPDFRAEVKAGEPAELYLTGNADATVSASFGALLTRLHAELEQARAAEVVVDMRALEFMSASAFNALVAWLGRVQELPLERRYRLRFRHNEQIFWQRRGLRTLACFAVDLVAIEA